MNAKTIQEQVQAGIDARVDAPIVHASASWSVGNATLLGLDGTSVDDAVEAAWTPSGPPREVLRTRIEFRRAQRPGRAALIPARAAA